ncbi:hypothetical protein F0562_015065 [Nyssa sinensis]|uniref:Uncharacterized protein n=1 Tax=Nyssa sinensis TaxID=561372 RepID=A0A5J4ZK37_9ASTE|nr:hypothetical protein F0562_015065 [Nyssa sinensis]
MAWLAVECENFTKGLIPLNTWKADAIFWLCGPEAILECWCIIIIYISSSLAPKVVTVVEQELSHAGSFLGRFVEAMHYYSALFDSLGASYGEENEKRHVVEQLALKGDPERAGCWGAI